MGLCRPHRRKIALAGTSSNFREQRPAILSYCFRRFAGLGFLRVKSFAWKPALKSGYSRPGTVERSKRQPHHFGVQFQQGSYPRWTESQFKSLSSFYRSWFQLFQVMLKLAQPDSCYFAVAFTLALDFRISTSVLDLAVSLFALATLQVFPLRCWHRLFMRGHSEKVSSPKQRE